MDALKQPAPAVTNTVLTSGGDGYPGHLQFLDVATGSPAFRSEANSVLRLAKCSGLSCTVRLTAAEAQPDFVLGCSQHVEWIFRLITTIHGGPISHGTRQQTEYVKRASSRDS